VTSVVILKIINNYYYYIIIINNYYYCDRKTSIAMTAANKQQLGCEELKCAK